MLLVFFFKQETAYEVRTSVWSSDVCSSYLGRRRRLVRDGWEIQTRIAAVARLAQLVRRPPALRRAVEFEPVEPFRVDVAEKVRGRDRRALVLDPQRDRAVVGNERDIGPRVGGGRGGDGRRNRGHRRGQD